MGRDVEEIVFYSDTPTPIAEQGITSTHIYKACKKVDVDIDDRFKIRHTGGGRWVQGRGKDTEVIARSTNNNHIVVHDDDENERRFIPANGKVYCYDKQTGEKKEHPDFSR